MIPVKPDLFIEFMLVYCAIADMMATPDKREMKKQRNGMLWDCLSRDVQRRRGYSQENKDTTGISKQRAYCTQVMMDLTMLLITSSNIFL